jgi:DNA-binding MarR family transcriptional regulator
VWPEDAYGVIAAEHKAGKSWAVLDLAVSVASGTAWLGLYPVERQGAVLMFLGEGGPRKTARRLRAIAAGRGLDFAELDLRMCFRVPHLSDADHLDQMRRELEAHPAALVVLDPLYLAARGAKGSQLYDMGAHLETIQELCQTAGCALVLVTHHNRDRGAKGSARMTGAGPAEWGRVLVNMAVRHRRVEEETQASEVVLTVSFEGDEIPETEITIRRRVWADDPDDLTSALHYEVTESKQAQVVGDLDMSPATRRVGLALALALPSTVREIGNVIAKDGGGPPLKKRTIQQSLADLEDMNLVDDDQTPAPRPRSYFLTESGQELFQERVP